MDAAAIFGIIIFELGFIVSLIWAFRFLNEPLMWLEHRIWKKMRRKSKVIYAAILKEINDAEVLRNERSKNGN